MLLLGFILFATNSFSQGKITGKIVQNDSTVLPGVIIYIENTKIGTQSNGLGKFSFEDLSEGTHTLVVSCVGYRTIKKEISVKKGEEVAITILLQELITDLPGIVITGGNVGVKELPPSAYYISPKELQRFNYSDINRTLRGIPGVNVQEEDGYGLRPNIGLRGTGVERNSKITVMEDGILIAPAAYAAPAAYYFPTIGRMQAVEIMKGSSQIKYGPYTTGGAINFISTPIPDHFSGKVNFVGGSYGFNSLHSNVGDSYKNFAFLVETFQYGSNGFKQLDGGGGTGFNKKDYLAKFRINTNADAKVYQSLTFKLSHSSETSDETYLGITESDFAINPLRRYAGSQVDQINTTQQTSSATHYVKFSKHIDITTTAYYTGFKRNWYKLNNLKDTLNKSIDLGSLLENPDSNPYMFDILKGANSPNSNALIVRANNREYYTQGIQTMIGIDLKTEKTKHKIDVGIRYHYDNMDRYQWDDEYKMANNIMLLTKAGAHGTESNRIEDAVALATFVQYQFKYKKITATPGLRYENITLSRLEYGKNDPQRIGTSLKETENKVDVLIPGIGIDYKFNNNLNSFIGVHKGFSPPGTTTGALPEESINFELGAVYSKDAFESKLVLFYNDYKNLLGSDMQASGGMGTTDLFNGGSAQAQGIEFIASYDLASNRDKKYRLPFTLSYTYTDAFFKSSFSSTFEDWGVVNEGDKLPYLAHNQMFAMMAFENKKIKISASGRYTDKMRTKAGSGAMLAEESTDAVCVIDMSASYLIQKQVAFFGSINNVANESYVVARRPFGVRPGMPRTFLIGIKTNF